jgi:HK97 gp10 family phage protein
MGDLTLSVRDATAVVRNLLAADKAAVEAIRKVTRRNGQKAYDIAQSLCPVDTGHMKEMMILEFTPDDLLYELGWDEQDFLSIGEPFYPPYQEYGTSRNAAQPSITPAYEEVHPQYQREVGQEVSASFERRKVQ